MSGLRVLANWSALGLACSPQSTAPARPCCSKKKNLLKSCRHGSEASMEPPVALERHSWQKIASTLGGRLQRKEKVLPAAFSDLSPKPA